ncbi:MAG: dockerin type I repeat-containing protein [Clostridia bacterium]|nr:dockerin type I repeat-containing protein [Clostridia bacterium]
MKKLLVFLLMLLLLSICVSAAHPIPAIDTSEAVEVYRNTFDDATSLNDFTMYNGNWGIEDGKAYILPGQASANAYFVYTGANEKLHNLTAETEYCPSGSFGLMAYTKVLNGLDNSDSRFDNLVVKTLPQDAGEAFARADYAAEQHGDDRIDLLVNDTVAVHKDLSMLNGSSGDVNGDGQVNVKDVMLGIRASLNNEYFVDADYDFDGKISLLDVIRILKNTVK